MSSCKWVDEALLLMKKKPKLGNAKRLHEACNELLYRLRCGNRRRRLYHHVRQQLRTYREAVTTWLPSGERY